MRHSVCLIMLSLAAAAVAQAPRYTACVSNEQLRHYATVASPRLSPDGATVVYIQRASTADGAGSHLWLAPTSGAAPARQITFSPDTDHAGESAPAFTPDGAAILFLAKRGSDRQVFRLPVNGGEASPLKIETPASPAPLPLSVEAFSISPDGQWLALRARQPQTAAEEKAVKDKNDAKLVDEDPHQDRVWLYNFTTEKVIALTPADRQAEAMAWSPDSRRLALVTSPPGNADDLGPRHQLAVLAIADPTHPQTLESAPPTLSTVAFSPDGQTLALLAQTTEDAPPGTESLFILSAAGGALRDLSDVAGSPAEAWSLSGRDLIWTPDGSAIYVQADHNTEAALARFPLAASAAPRWLPLGAPQMAATTDFATNLRQTGWTFVGQATDRLPQVQFAPSLDATSARPLSRANPDWAATGWAQGTEVSWPGPGGLEIHGLYFAPRAPACPDASALTADKSPLILVIHGGPAGTFSQTFSPLVQLFAASGWAVLEPNPRGSTGYGWRFVAANKNDLGGRDYDDIMAGLDWALANRPLDPHRLGVYGYSYGGEMAAFIEGKTDRFAAIVSGAPVINQYSEYGTESGSWYDRWYFGEPWMHPQDAWRQSPLSFASHAKTPFLLLQGEADITDPLGQSEEMYRALRQMGVPVRLMTFPREVHGTLSGGISGSPSAEPWHGFEARTQLLQWFGKNFAISNKQ